MKDPNFRIFTDRETITVFNDELFIRGTDIQDIFRQLGVDDPTHAFYLGRELMKATTRHHAWQDLPAGGIAQLGLPHPARRREIRAREDCSPPAPGRAAARAPGRGTMSEGRFPLVENLGETGEPIDVVARFLDLPFALFLDSATGATARSEVHPLGRYSFFSADPAMVIRSKGGLTEIPYTGGRRDQGSGRSAPCRARSH